MKICYYVLEADYEIDLFDSEGVPPQVDGDVYIRDYRPKSDGFREIRTVKYKVMRVDHSIILDSKRMSEFSDEEKRSIMTDYDHPVEKMLDAKIFNINLVTNEIEFSRSCAKVLLSKSEDNERSQQEST